METLAAAVSEVVGSEGLEGKEAGWVGRFGQARAEAAQEAVEAVAVPRAAGAWAAGAREAGVPEEAVKDVGAMVEGRVELVEERVVATAVDLEAVASTGQASLEMVCRGVGRLEAAGRAAAVVSASSCTRRNLHTLSTTCTSCSTREKASSNPPRSLAEAEVGVAAVALVVVMAAATAAAVEGAAVAATVAVTEAAVAAVEKKVASAGARTRGSRCTCPPTNTSSTIRAGPSRRLFCNWVAEAETWEGAMAAEETEGVETVASEEGVKAVVGLAARRAAGNRPRSRRCTQRARSCPRTHCRPPCRSPSSQTRTDRRRSEAAAHETRT